ncbi:MAG: hypothetical protein N3E37_03345 [Candidatus Micrarchaeota archaeon]|nr:hypothetical protein [Candidatus Micrarchaeota archaeon]
MNINELNHRLLNAKAQVATELLVFLAVFLVVFLISIGYYFENIRKTSQTVAMQEAEIVQTSIARGINLALLNPGTNVSVVLPTKLADINYLVNISKSPTGTQKYIDIDVIELQNRITYRKTINLTTISNLALIKLQGDISNQNLTIDPLSNSVITIHTVPVGNFFDVEVRK